VVGIESGIASGIAIIDQWFGDIRAKKTKTSLYKKRLK
jgi:hypothetical protein